jgi:hypothetical protein
MINGMQFSEIRKSVHNGNVWLGVDVQFGQATKWSILWAIGNTSEGKNLVSVCKLTNNPFGGKIGKWFSSFDEAQGNYKDANLKSAILMAEDQFRAYLAQQNQSQILQLN